MLKTAGRKVEKGILCGRGPASTMWIPIHRGQKAKRGSAIACSCCALKLDQLILLVTTCWTNEGICHRLLRTCCFRSDGAALLLILGLFLSIGPLSCLKKKKNLNLKNLNLFPLLQ